MQATVIIEPMQAVEARAALLAIGGNLKSASDLALDFDRRRGWKALGYENLATCFEAELGISPQHGYRLLQLGEVRANITAHTGEKPDALKEYWMRETGLNRLTPQQQAEAYVKAQALQEAEQEKHLAAHHLHRAVDEIRKQSTVVQSKYHIITHLMVTGVITADTAQRMNDYLEAMKPKVRGTIIQLIAKYAITCADLLPPIADMVARQDTDKPSLVYSEIATGYLGGVALRNATLTDLRRAQNEARLQHIADSEEERRLKAIADGKRVSEPVIITVYVDEPERTTKALEQALGSDGLAQLMQYWLDTMIEGVRK